MKLINMILNAIGTAPATYNPAMNSVTAGMNTMSGSASMLGTNVPTKSTNKQIFSGRIEVMQVANGYVINIATREGYEMDTYVASTIAEVNERIAASMVSFQLGKK